MPHIFSLQKIQVNLDRDEWIRNAANFLLSRFDSRFPLSHQMIASAIVDPEIQHLPAVGEWLDQHEETRLTVLTRIARDFEINIEPEQEEQPKPDKYIQRKSPAIDIRSMLIRKHSSLSNKKSNIQDELNRFININENTSDVLEFWRANQCAYPSMAKIAKVLLSKPSTSAKSESAFSVAGALLRDRRATIDPLRVQKTLFIHDNYAFLKSDM